MEFNTFYNKIQTDESMMETIQHGNSEYPFQLYYDDLALFDFHCVEWHWHVEFEFVFVQEGTATFWVGEKQFSLGQGTGIFINSKILHRYFSEGHAIVPNFVLKPTFLAPADSLIYKKYIAPIQACKVDCIVFCREIKWQAEALELMQKILKAQESDKDRELVTLFLTQELWHLLYLHMDSEVLQKKRENTASSQGRTQLMMQYIHQKFPTESYIGGYRRAGYGEQKYGIESVPKISSRYAGALSGEVSSAGGCKASGHDGEKDNCNFRRDGI